MVICVTPKWGSEERFSVNGPDNQVDNVVIYAGSNCRCFREPIEYKTHFLNVVDVTPLPPLIRSSSQGYL